MRKRVKWLVRLKGPVSHFPGGTIRVEPPSEPYWLSLLIAELKAFVFDVFPSPTPPKSFKLPLCFLQLMAEYSVFANSLWTLLSATFTFTDPSITIKEITPRTCTYNTKLIISIQQKPSLWTISDGTTCPRELKSGQTHPWFLLKIPFIVDNAIEKYMNNTNQTFAMWKWSEYKRKCINASQKLY